ncbi:MoaD/ThiS family protein [Candidatus Woesearchaeota archaeon]|jgi:sulfur carrier protein ThiS|nr:MoaD/ThiS family protein [Candidatus Woesearchaeota archaeon]MBT7367874.1 MoaD/ThiS family protein [Candidatus Woesearchaeota archaeon]
MKIFIEKENKIVNKTINSKEILTVKDLLIELNINQETVIITKNNTLVLVDEKLDNKDEVKILSVISGG